jgi:hypothetical protein
MTLLLLTKAMFVSINTIIVAGLVLSLPCAADEKSSGLQIEVRSVVVRAPVSCRNDWVVTVGYA